MTRPVVLHADAAAELEDAACWYDDQREGLGLQFLAAVDRAVQHARDWAQSGSPVPDVSADLDVRRLPVTPFPYHVIYMINDGVVHVLAIAHSHRRPRYWKHRTRREGPEPPRDASSV